MATVPPVPKTKEQKFCTDIVEDGYHILNLKSAKIPGFYPNKFPAYPGVKLKELTVDERITVRAFFRVGTGEPVKVDGGLIDLKIEHIDSDHVFGVVLTRLPERFPVSTGSSLEIHQDEILYKID